MLSIAVLSAGSGYEYYLRETASMDASRDRQGLEDYYLAQGAPPGQWIGSGCASLQVDGSVEESQMRALFGEGRHPDADAMKLALIEQGMDETRAENRTFLGRRFADYSQENTHLGDAITAEMERFVRENHREPLKEERHKLRVKVAAKRFSDHYGRRHVDDAELRKYLKRHTSPRKAVSGFDLTFSAQKSVSLLWGLGDRETQLLVETCHENAIRDTIRWLEQNAVTARTGKDGVASVDVEGIVATKFRHYESRDGDPQLHDHVVIANRVRDRKTGKWLTLDSKLLHAQTVTASEVYNRRIMEELELRLGVVAEDRIVAEGKRPVREIAGIPVEMIRTNSSRRAAIQTKIDELTREYVEKHGHNPDRKNALKIAQEATLTTRTTKEEHRSLHDLRVKWHANNVREHGANTVNLLVENARVAGQKLLSQRQPKAWNLQAVALEILGTVAQHYTSWSRTQVTAEAQRFAAKHPEMKLTGENIDAIVTSALRSSISLTPTIDLPKFAELENSNGLSIYRPRIQRYTSSAILSMEDDLLKAGRLRAETFVTTERFDKILAARTGIQLNDQQRDLARQFACGDTALIVGIGPAGTGKTTALSLVSDAVKASGGRVLGLTTSSAAASVLGSEIDAPSHTISRFFYALDNQDMKPLAPEMLIRPGDVVLVDEAGMVGTHALNRITQHVIERGGVVRLMGDDRQLQAIESGGALRLLSQQLETTVRLEEVHRFKTEGEAKASLALRDGSADTAFKWYLRTDRVHGSDRTTATRSILDAWCADRDAGKLSLMMLDTAAAVVELNAEAQAYEVVAGRVVFGAEHVLTRDELRIGYGDMIVTRNNDRRLIVHQGRDFVKNGDTWTVEGFTERGDIIARHTDHGGVVHLPAKYVQRSVELGYASTVHRAQGRTVDTGHVLVTSTSSREAAYVGLTRGRLENHVYAVVEDTETLRGVLTSVASNDTRAISAHELVAQSVEDARNPAELVGIYADVLERANTIRYTRTLTGVLRDLGFADRIDELFERSDQGGSILKALRTAEDKGFNIDRVLRQAARGVDKDIEDLGDAITDNIVAHLDAAEKLATGETHRTQSLVTLTPTEFDDLMARTRTEWQDALNQRNAAQRLVDADPHVIDVPARTKIVYGRDVIIAYSDGTRETIPAVQAHGKPRYQPSPTTIKKEPGQALTGKEQARIDAITHSRLITQPGLQIGPWTERPLGPEPTDALRQEQSNLRLEAWRVRHNKSTRSADDQRIDAKRLGDVQMELWMRRRLPLRVQAQEDVQRVHAAHLVQMHRDPLHKERADLIARIAAAESEWKAVIAEIADAKTTHGVDSDEWKIARARYKTVAGKRADLEDERDNLTHRTAAARGEMPTIDAVLSDEAQAHLRAVEDAQRRVNKIVDVHEALLAEERYRHATPERSIVEQRIMGVVPEWIAPRLVSTQHLKPEWVNHMTRMQTQMQETFTQLGETIAAEPPEWATRALGDLPPETEPKLRAAWKHLAAELHTWRSVNGHDHPIYALPRDNPHDNAIVATLRTDVTNLRDAMRRIEQQRYRAEQLEKLRETTRRMEELKAHSTVATDKSQDYSRTYGNSTPQRTEREL